MEIEATEDSGVGAIVEMLRRRAFTLASAESLTGGLVGASLTSVPGASAVYRGGVIAYSTDVKNSLLGVPNELLAEEGPVHPEVARHMSRGVRTLLRADVGVATTGVAGPDRQGESEVGTVFVAVSVSDEDCVRRLTLSGDRQQIRENTVAVLWEVVGEVLG